VKAVPGFTAKYGVDRLVWFERHDTLETAMQREKRIKRWKRVWKIELIEKDNPHWVDLYPSISGSGSGGREDGGMGPGFRRDSAVGGVRET
jgi:putative endonuclease